MKNITQSYPSFFKVWLITQKYLKGQFPMSLLWIALTWSVCHLLWVVKIPLYPMCFVWIEMACSWWLWPSWWLRSLAGTDFWFRADLLRLSQAARCFPCTNGTAQGQRGPVNVSLASHELNKEVSFLRVNDRLWDYTQEAIRSFYTCSDFMKITSICKVQTLRLFCLLMNMYLHG